MRVAILLAIFLVTNGSAVAGAISVTSPDHASTQVSQIFPVPGCGDTFPRRIRPRLIRAGCDALLAEFADVPILFVSHVPEFDRVLGAEIGLRESIWMKKPIAADQCS